MKNLKGMESSAKSAGIRENPGNSAGSSQNPEKSAKSGLLTDLWGSWALSFTFVRICCLGVDMGAWAATLPVFWLFSQVPCAWGGGVFVCSLSFWGPWLLKLCTFAPKNHILAKRPRKRRKSLLIKGNPMKSLIFGAPGCQPPAKKGARKVPESQWAHKCVSQLAI